MDYTGSSAEIGKNIGDDFTEGKITLPLIYALQSATSNQRQAIEEAIRKPSPEALPDIITFIQKTDAIERCHLQAYRHNQIAIQAIHTLPNSKYKQSLLDLLEFSLRRHF